jgi:hypothetical protein
MSSNKAKADWEAFRRYKYRIEIEEADQFIAMGQRETSSQGHYNVKVWGPLISMLFVGGGIVAIILAIILAVVLNLGIMGGILLAIASFFGVALLAYRFFWRRTNKWNTLVIANGFLVCDSVALNKRLPVKKGSVFPYRGLSLPWPLSPAAIVIPLDQIKSVDVHQGNDLESNLVVADIVLNHYYVVVWDGPRPVRTVGEITQEEAIALKEGVVAAIGVMNPATVQATPAKPRRGFMAG